VISWLRRVGAFWYDFIVGDDWRVALAVVAALGLTAVLAHAGIHAWPVLPVTVLVVLPISLCHARRSDNGQRDTSD